jgi:hypothetical protein
MKLFEEYLNRKHHGEVLDIDEISKADLQQLFFTEEMSDKSISALFNVSSSRVTHMRRKMGISLKECIFEDLMLCKSGKALIENKKCRDSILSENNIDMIAKAITHFAFRNGPIEDMHADPNCGLSDENMKELNKYMVNRLASIINLMIKNRWIQFDVLIRHIDSVYGKDWDRAEVDEGEISSIVNAALLSNAGLAKNKLDGASS